MKKACAQKPIVLFHPHVPRRILNPLKRTLNGRWIGQGPRVARFEDRFQRKWLHNHAQAIAVGAGTDALHLAYLLAGIGENDTVIAPVLTCAATNIPLLYLRANVVFADIQTHSLNINPEHVADLISPNTKAIVCTHYGGLPCDLAALRTLADRHGIPLIEDAAQALGATYQGRAIGTIADFAAFSFQAVKQITTGDGGMLVLKSNPLAQKARRLRWFGIDRDATDHWRQPITEVGYKYQMTDIAATLGLAGLADLGRVLKRRRAMLDLYHQCLAHTPGLRPVGVDLPDRQSAAWLCTVLVENRSGLIKKLQAHRIESSPVHLRNDFHPVFNAQKAVLPGMDSVESRYLSLPLHTKLQMRDVHRICDIINQGW